MKESLINEEEEEINARPSILDPNPMPQIKDEWDEKSSCGKFCHYFFCCCCCVKYERNKNYYKKGWQNYLVKEGNKSSDKPFQLLTNLFANADNAIESLNTMRLNPNLVSQNKLRNDLEFYIPQLCTFLLFGEVKEIEEFFVFLCKVCNILFFFAHRVYWFLSAMINSSQEKKDDILEIIKMINTLFKSENKKKKEKIEKFYIANSQQYIDYIRTNNLYFLYNSKIIDENKNIFENIDFNSLNMIQQLTYNKFKESRDRIEKFCDKEYDKAKFKEVKNLKESGKLKNLSQNILNEIKKNDDENLDEINTNSNFDNGKQFDPNDFYIGISNFKLDNSNINIDDLLEISEIEDDNEKSTQDFLYNNNDNFVNYKKTTKDINYISYHSTLNFIEHLCDISNDLPKHPIDEQMLFLYKKLNQINKKLPCNVYLPFLKDSARNYIICHIPLDGVKIFRTKTRCPIMLTFEMVRIEEINNEIKKTIELDNEIEHKGSKSIGSLNLSSNNINAKGKKLKLMNDMIISDDYMNLDYELSRPLLISNQPKTTIQKNNKLSSSGNVDKNDEKFTKIVRKFKERHTISAFGNQSPSKMLLETKSLKLKDNKSNKAYTKLMEKISNIEDIIEETDEESIISHEGEDQPVKKSLNYEDFKNIFGETFEQKEENLKKTSPFGKFKTYKLFRCIFKTHEDLRQEQFATQLINEFNQIFKIEKVKCWLNTYEIISTGNDSGLVEMVNNSLSLDQLKQKLNNISLSDFYLYYFGKGHKDSKEYKKAMNNYVSSLAGYSLVCYFLQIKDRHNGNILIDNQGYLTHIDFGFLLSNAPGKGIKFEKAPFKLSRDMLECLGGNNGKYFEKFRNLLKEGFMAIFKHRQKIIILVEMMWCGNGRNLDCFEKGQEAIDELKLRLQPKDCKKKSDANRYVDQLIKQSVDNWRTKWYDIFQYYVQGIFY